MSKELLRLLRLMALRLLPEEAEGCVEGAVLGSHLSQSGIWGRDGTLASGPCAWSVGLLSQSLGSALPPCAGALQRHAEGDGAILNGYSVPSVLPPSGGGRSGL